MGIGVTEPLRISAQDQTKTNGRPPTSVGNWTLSCAEEVWEWLGIGMTERPRTSAQDRTWMDGRLPTSTQDRTWTTGWPRTSAQDRTLSSPEEVWERLGIGVTESPRTSAQDQAPGDGRLPTPARDQMQVDERLQTSFKGMATVPGMPESDGGFQAVQAGRMQNGSCGNALRWEQVVRRQRLEGSLLGKGDLSGEIVDGGHGRDSAETGSSC